MNTIFVMNLFDIKNIHRIVASLLFFTFLLPSTASAFNINIGTISPNRKVPVGTTISFTFDTDTSDIKYTLTDTLPGSTLSNSHINFNTFSWTPQSQDMGTHSVTITAFDSVGIRRTLSEEFVVTEASGVLIKNAINTSLYPGETVSFSVAANGFISPVFSVQDSVSGSSLKSSSIDSFGNFNWKPNSRDVGVHNLQVTVSNVQGRRETVYQTVVVKGVQVESVPATLRSGIQVSFPVKIYGMSNVTYRIRDTLRGNTIDSARIENERFVWTPSAQDVGSHSITVTAIDGNSISEHTFGFTVTSNNQNNTEPSSEVKQVVSKILFKKDIRVGSTGTEVRELQKRLTSEKVYTGPINGVFGPQTKKAVQLLQKKHKLPQTGIVGPQTREVLNG